MANNINDEYLKRAAKKANVDINELKKAAQSGNVDDFINKNLSENASKKLKSVLSDKDAAQKLLSTPEAKQLLEKLMKGQ